MFRIARYGGLTTAAALLIALVGSFWFLDSGTAFADVLKAVNEARSVSFTMASQFGHGPATGMKFHQQGSVIRYEMPGVMLVMADLDPNNVQPCSTEEFLRPAQRPMNSCLRSERSEGLQLTDLPSSRPALERAVRRVTAERE